jgi:hypothetical protein
VDSLQHPCASGRSGVYRSTTRRPSPSRGRPRLLKASVELGALPAPMNSLAVQTPMANQRLNAERDHGQDRRGFPRYPALDNTSQVGWWRNGQVETTSAQLMDVSREGMLVLVDDEPPQGVAVMIRLIQPTPTAWVEARVTESRPMRQGPYQLRLVFSNGSPAGFFALAASRCEEMN